MGGDGYYGLPARDQCQGADAEVPGVGETRGIVFGLGTRAAWAARASRVRDCVIYAWERVRPSRFARA